MSLKAPGLAIGAVWRLNIYSVKDEDVSRGQWLPPFENREGWGSPRHNTLRCTPAMAAGIERDFWSVGDLVEAAA
jgi:hypothetical protein